VQGNKLKEKEMKRMYKKQRNFCRQKEGIDWVEFDDLITWNKY
jgi:hypothetical protein